MPVCVNDPYSGFIYRFAEAFDAVLPAKWIRAEANLKTEVDNEIMSTTQRWNKKDNR